MIWNSMRTGVYISETSCIRVGLVLSCACCFSMTLMAQQLSSKRQLIVVVGAAGTEEYGTQFSAWADRWKEAAVKANMKLVEVGRMPADLSDKESLKSHIDTLQSSDLDEAWIVLIGHGTFYRDVAKFNLRGADVSAKELASWIRRLQRPLVIVNCASSSGPFINRLSGLGRTIVTATKSGSEQNFTRFGAYLSEAIADVSADLDHDDEVSLLEAFLSASGRVARFYESENRLATEHALIDDNGDTLGTAATFFSGVRATKTSKGGSVDGRTGSRVSIFRSERALTFSESQRKQRSMIEQQIDKLRDAKSDISEDDYRLQFESLAVQMAELYEAVEQDQKASKPRIPDASAPNEERPAAN